jgi:hypothetical protein
MGHLSRTTRHAAAFDELFVGENFSFDAVTAIFNRIVADVDATGAMVQDGAYSNTGSASSQ